MPSYVEILDTQLDPDAPITSGLGYQFRNNPIAMAEGDEPAPRVDYLALKPRFFYDANVSTFASGTSIASIDLLSGRGCYLEMSSNLTLNGGSNLGTSQIDVEGSNDNVNFTSLVSIATSSGLPITLNEVNLFDFSSETYRYYRVYADGDSDHAVSGLIYLKVAGTVDPT